MNPSNALLPDPVTAWEVAPCAVNAWLDQAEDERPLLLDCREEDEVNFAKIHGSRWIRLAEVNASAEAIRAMATHGVVVYCHLGMRSLRAAQMLRAHGIHQAFSMAGGIAAWSRSVDPSIPQY